MAQTTDSKFDPIPSSQNKQRGHTLIFPEYRQHFTLLASLHRKDIIE